MTQSNYFPDRTVFIKTKEEKANLLKMKRLLPKTKGYKWKTIFKDSF